MFIVFCHWRIYITNAYTCELIYINMLQTGGDKTNGKPFDVMPCYAVHAGRHLCGLAAKRKVGSNICMDVLPLPFFKKGSAASRNDLGQHPVSKIRLSTFANKAIIEAGSNLASTVHQPSMPPTFATGLERKYSIKS